MITVVLADDHAILRDGLRFLLEAAGDIQVLSMAANGREAVEQAALYCPDVAVIDVSMPIMSGIEATRQILKSCPHTKVLILGMQNTDEYVRLARQAGASGYILKDTAGAELVAAIRSLYNGRQYISSRVTGKLAYDFLSGDTTTDAPPPKSKKKKKGKGT